MDIDTDRHDHNKATKLAAGQVLCGLMMLMLLFTSYNDLRNVKSNGLMIIMNSNVPFVDNNIKDAQLLFISALGYRCHRSDLIVDHTKYEGCTKQFIN